jgi:pyridoxine 4-dehydrogenase
MMNQSPPGRRFDDQLAWLLDLAPNVLLIPGTRTRAHLAENLGSAVVELDDGARAELARAFPAPR